MAVTLIIYFYLPKSIQEVQRGVLIERAHYYTILVEGVRTIREGLLIEGAALTEVVRYINPDSKGTKRSVTYWATIFLQGDFQSYFIEHKQ